MLSTIAYPTVKPTVKPTVVRSTPLKARISQSGIIVTFTARGPHSDFIKRGYIRLNGHTVTGHIYDGGNENIFYPDTLGVNYDLVRLARNAEKTAA